MTKEDATIVIIGIAISIIVAGLYCTYAVHFLFGLFMTALGAFFLYDGLDSRKKLKRGEPLNTDSETTTRYYKIAFIPLSIILLAEYFIFFSERKIFGFELLAVGAIFYAVMHFKIKGSKKKDIAEAHKLELQKLPFDLSGINVKQLAEDFSKQISKPQPDGWVTKWWQNKKLPMDNERIMYLTEYVERMRGLNEQIVNMKYELFIAPTVLEELIQGHIDEFKRKSELEIKEHQANIHRLDMEMERLYLENEKLKAEIEQIKRGTPEEFRLLAEIEQVKAKTKLLEEQTGREHEQRRLDKFNVDETVRQTKSREQD